MVQAAESDSRTHKLTQRFVIRQSFVFPQQIEVRVPILNLSVHQINGIVERYYYEDVKFSLNILKKWSFE